MDGRFAVAFFFFAGFAGATFFFPVALAVAEVFGRVPPERLAIERFTTVFLAEALRLPVLARDVAGVAFVELAFRLADFFFAGFRRGALFLVIRLATGDIRLAQTLVYS